MTRTYFVLLGILLLLLAPGAGRGASAVHSVERGETLHRISRQHGITVEQLKAWNHLSSNRIYPGQKLRVQPPSPVPSAAPPTTEYEVRKGDTLASIALRYGVSVAYLRRMNGIEGSHIVPGQKLRIRGAPSSATDAAEASAVHPSVSTHVVARGEFLGKIARQYGMNTAELKRLNGLRSDRIYPGQKLQVTSGPGPRTRSYRVRPGDNLTDIAKKFGMTLAELRKINGVRGSLIHPGQELTVVDARIPAGGWIELSDIDWQSLSVAPEGVRTIVVENGPYFFQSPRAGEQKSTRYFEGSPDGPLATYRRAHELWKEFEAKVDGMGRLSRQLEGWHIVLDPGHGGQDPGTIVKSRDGNDEVLYVVEDEYVYDIALRMYVLLRLHGADVTITVLSPNHLIRRSEQPTRTFVHEKNEVYNSYEHNKSNSAADWPRGRYAGLKPRVDIARRAFANVPEHQTIFISLHADNSPNSPIAPSVRYYSRNGKDDERSKRFAQQLLPSLRAGAIVRGQRLAVLRNNPAHVKVLVEVRNLAYRDNVWALRVEALRQRDAEKLVDGILHYAGSSTIVAR